MARQNDFDLTVSQREAWLEQAAILQGVLSRHDGAIYLEFIISRMGRRIDAVVIIGAVIFVLEFKVGETRSELRFGPGPDSADPAGADLDERAEERPRTPRQRPAGRQRPISRTRGHPGSGAAAARRRLPRAYPDDGPRRAAGASRRARP